MWCDRPKLLPKYLTLLHYVTTLSRVPVRISSSMAMLLTLTPMLAAAQTPGTRPDPFGPIVDEALKANLTVQSERWAGRRAAAEVRGAVGAWLPRIDASSRYTEYDDERNLGDLINPAYRALNQLTGGAAFPTDLDIPLLMKHDTNVAVTQPILAEEIRAGISAARARHDAQRSIGAATARQIAAAAQIAYLHQASALRAIEIHEAALALASENERVAQRLLDAGKATAEATLRARADRAEVEQQLAEARAQHTAALGEFNRILGRPLEDPAEPIDDGALDLPIDMTPDAAVASALAYRDELAAARAGVRAAAAGRRAVAARYMPMVAARFDYGFHGSEVRFDDSDNYWAASIVADWEILDFGREARRGVASSDLERSRLALRDAEERARLDVMNAYEAAITARDAIATAEARLDASRRTFDLVRRRYDQGAASPLELTDARTKLTAAELNHAVTKYQYAIRWVDLERAAALRAIPF